MHLQERTDTGTSVIVHGQDDDVYRTVKLTATVDAREPQSISVPLGVGAKVDSLEDSLEDSQPAEPRS